eukprot:COSAG06_NODE_22850_length_710_cov_1.780687_1_plen_214_part_10
MMYKGSCIGDRPTRGRGQPADQTVTSPVPCETILLVIYCIHKHTAIMARVTVADLRNEARRKLKECGGGKTISRMNRTELIRFLQCIDDRALADTYEQQQADRDYERAQTVPAGFFSEQKPRRKKQKVDDQVTLTRRRKKTSGSGHCMTGAGHMTYRQFIQGALPELRAKGMSSQDAMRAAAALWKRHKMKGGGLKPAGAVTVWVAHPIMGGRQ